MSTIAKKPLGPMLVRIAILAIGISGLVAIFSIERTTTLEFSLAVLYVLLGCISGIFILVLISTRIQFLKLSHRNEKVDAQLEMITELVSEANLRLEAVQKKLGIELQSVSANGIDSISRLRRIVTALETRMDYLLELLNTGDLRDLAKAEALAEQALVVRVDPLHQSIDAATIPPLHPTHWRHAVNTMLNELDEELNEVWTSLGSVNLE